LMTFTAFTNHPSPLQPTLNILEVSLVSGVWLAPEVDAGGL
jgi:hypothetical protein